MLKTCFYFLINMSISGSMVIILLLLVRKIRIIPKRLIYPLWIIAMLRMSLPFAISSSISVFNVFSDLVKKVIPVGKVLDTDLTTTNYFNATTSHFPMEYKTQRLEEIFNTSATVWEIGVLIALLCICVLYLTVFYRFRKSKCINSNIYTNENATSPFLLGIIKPRIILPTEFDIDSEQAIHIIAHERVHMKRYDNLWRLVGLLITCMHWFNPIAWLGLSFFLKDMELSCDETAVKNYSTAKRKEYANSLLSIAEKTQKQNPITVGFGKSNAKTRVVGVLKYQRLSLVGAIASIGFLLLVALMLITNPQIETFAKQMDREPEIPMLDLGFDTNYSPLADINIEKIIERQINENQIVNSGVLFEKTKGYEKITSNNEFVLLLIDEYGNYITVGESEQRGGYRDICITKYDSSGNELKRQTYGGRDFEMVYAAKYNPNMGIVITGISQSEDGDFADYTAIYKNSPFVCSIDPQTLAIRWISYVQIADFVYCVTDNSVFVVRNEGEAYKKGALKLSVVKLDNEGKKVWQTEPLEQWVHCIAELTDGRVIVVQKFADNRGMGEDGAIICYSKDGTELSKMKADCYGEVTPTADGGFIIVLVRNIKTIPQPAYISAIWFDMETVVTKYDKRSKVEWRKTYDNVKGDLGIDTVIPQSDGSVAVEFK